MRTSHRFIAFVLTAFAFALALGLTACGDDTNTTTDQSVIVDMAPAADLAEVIGCGQAKGAYKPDACAPSGAKGDGMCRCIIGWHWDGMRCAGLGGCTCIANCDRVYATEEACRLAYARCLDAK